MNENELEQSLTEALQKTAQIVDTIKEDYRNVAFPIILQALLGTSEVSGIQRQNTQAYKTIEQEAPTPMLPANMSVNEFIRKANPDTHPGRFVCIAYYLMHTGRAMQFTQADILEAYQRLRQPAPKNPTDVMNQCIRKAHVIDAPTSVDKQKQWVITPEGEKYVEGLLNANANTSNAISR